MLPLPQKVMINSSIEFMNGFVAFVDEVKASRRENVETIYISRDYTTYLLEAIRESLPKAAKATEESREAFIERAFKKGATELYGVKLMPVEALEPNEIFDIQLLFGALD